MKTKLHLQLLGFFLFASLNFLHAQCQINNAGIVYQCQENNPWDPNDDTFTFTLNPTGTGLGSSYFIEGNIGFGEYDYGGPSGPFGPFPVDAATGQGGEFFYLYEDGSNCNGLSVLAYPTELCFNYIEGPDLLCAGECATYTPSSLDPNANAFYFWEMSDGTTSTETFFTPCFQGPGVYNIYLTTFDSLQQEEMDTFFVYIEDFYTPEINSNSTTTCPDNGGNFDCDQVCANSQVTYTVDGPGGGTTAIWNVSGAASFDDFGSYIIVNWGAAGAGTVNVETFSITGSCGGFNSLCVNIIENPIAEIKSNPPVINGVVEICEGQTLFLENLSSGASSYLWDFGNGLTSTEANPTTVYTTEGTYEVSLIAYNDCFCSDITKITINVEDAISPEIQCVGTICENETVTYTTTADCTVFNWNISSNGTITDGGGTSDNSITVDWGLGPVGTIELLVESCNGDYCIAPAIEEIGIISDDAEIEGKEIVCLGESTSYSITQYDGTDYFWEVSNFGTIESGQGTNSIIVRWNDSNFPSVSQSVKVNYSSCYLECGGEDTHTVNIRPGFYAEGPIEVCKNSTTDYTSRTDQGASTLLSSNWELTAADGSVVWNAAANSQVSIDWNVNPGQYLLTVLPADPTEVCEDQYTVTITVADIPPPVSSINGEDLICPGEFYTYNAVSTQPENNFEWTFTDGSGVVTILGNPVNHAWASTGPYVVSVAQISSTGLACKSAEISLNVNAIADFTLAGTDELCQEEIGQYTATDYDNVEYEWTIDPADAGTIITGDNSATVDILWHKSGPATVTAALCGLSKQLSVTVNALPEPTVNFPAALCPGATASVSTNLVYDAYVWRNENGGIVSTMANPSLNGGYYQVEVTDVNGCKEDTTFYIETLPLPVISISTPASTGYCTTVDPLTIYAVDTDAGYTYDWYKDNVAVGITTDFLSVNDFGNYRVIVTDENGCTNSSNTINIFEYCGPLSGGTCTGGSCNLPQDCPGTGLIQFDIQSTSECNVSNFINTSTSFVPGTFTWNFDDPGSGINNSSNLENPSHTYSNAGFYKVLLYGKVPTATGEATCWLVNVDTVLAVADFDAELACAGSTIQLEDLSTFIPSLTNLTSWSWNFGDPLSGIDNTSNLQHPSHIFAVDGTYTVTLTITDATGCTSTKTRDITVHPLPAVSFPQPVINCEGTAMQFDLVGSPNITYVEWDFGDPASGAANRSEQENTFHIFATPGNYTVTLTAENIYGCQDVYTDVIVVEPNGLNGEVDFSNASPICEGDVTTLTAPTGGIEWLWSTGAQTESITVSDANVYQVTITNSEGCTYVPGKAIVDVIAAPTTEIRAVTYDDYGQPIGYSYLNYTICEGDDVFLQVEDNAQYTFSWSNGEVDETEIVFSEERGNLLVAGTYDFSVTVTDNDTGCSDVEGPFQVVVNPTPVDVMISSSAPLPICGNTPTTLSVNNPDPAFDYVWSNGVTGTSLSTSLPGAYYVTAINSFGCEAESDRIIINAGPDIRRVPGGCFTRCNPDTICLPSMPSVVSFQWYLDGVAIPAPEGTVADLIATQSGDYHVEMVDNIGCVTESGILSLELLDGYGTFEGNVYFDVNGNGVIDAGDTEMSDVDIQLTDNTGVLDTKTTDMDGFYTFQNILSQPYTLVLDTMSIPSYYSVNPVAVDSQLVGCDDLEEVNWLVYLDCPTLLDTVYFETCPNEPVVYNGTTLLANTETPFTFVTNYGCDSIVLVIVEDLGSSAGSTLNLQTCAGGTTTYEGVDLSPGDVMAFTLKNQFNCDSIVTVTVAEIPVITTALTLNTCAGNSIVYEGFDIEAGTERLVELEGYLGCDSLVNVKVEAFPTADFDLNTNLTCWNENLGEISVANLTSGTGPFEYSLDGVNYQADPLFENLKGGQQMVSVRDANGCVVEKETTISEISPLTITNENTIFPCSAESVELAVLAVATNSAGISYNWIDGETDATMDINEPGRYWVALSNECETVEHTIDVPLAKDDNTEFLYLPNVFSPNDDGNNDLYGALPADDVIVLAFDLQIFDRWGNLVFMSNDVSKLWDGKYKGARSSSGVFIWKLKATIESCNRQIDLTKNGDLTLLK
ncbi:MAG: PKD domain-containing protein [Saprospiraceae bacterium]